MGGRRRAQGAIESVLRTARGDNMAAYQALYRKWRPRRFADIVGQEPIITTLVNQIVTNRIPHAYLFCGSRGNRQNLHL